MFCTELYAHEQRILWAPSFFLRLCADESRRRRRESGTEKISLPRRGDQHRHELPRDDGAPTQIEGIWGTTCSNFGSAFGDTSRAELLKFSFRSNVEEDGMGAAAVVGESAISLEVYFIIHLSHMTCVSLFCLWPLSACIFYDVCLRMNLIRTDHLPSPSAATSHPLFRRRIFGNAFLPK